jgi:type IV pilus assembly protein PilY1
VKWRSVVVGAGGDGAQTVFAVDIPTTVNPITHLVPPMTAGNVMWEVNNVSGTDTTFGNIVGRPAIGKLANSGTWVAIFGNGYNSQAGTANLYVVRLNDGAVLQIIPTNSSYTGNGLGATEIVRKSSGDADTIDYVYGADYKGHIWRFDLSQLNSGLSNWSTALPTLVYTTPTGRPITAELKVGAAPSGPGVLTTGGKMIYFGTGSFLAATDPALTSVQALYGIYDDLSPGSNSSPSVSDASLSSMTITMVAGADTRQTSNASTPNWYTVANKKGWVVPLTGTNVTAGERVIAPPVRYTVPGLVDAILFTSIVPGLKECDAGLDAWITGVDAMTGGYVAVFNGLVANSVKVAGGSPRGVFVLSETGSNPALYISQTVFNNTISTTSYTTGSGGSQDVTINGVTGTTRIISVDLAKAPPIPTPTTNSKQVWRQLR